MLELRLEEEKTCSCRAISHFLHTLEFPVEYDSAREMILRDLCSRVGELQPLERAIVLAETLQSLLPKRMRATFDAARLGLNEFEGLRREKKEKRNVGIVTVIGAELRGVLTVLGRPLDAEPDERSGEFSYWFAEIQRPHQDALRVVVTMIAEARNVPCAIAVEHLLNDYDLDVVILVGIAAGPREKVKLGDVVYADQVYDYEEYRLELMRVLGFVTNIRRARPRPQYISTRKQIKVALERFDPKKFSGCFTESLSRVADDLLPKQYARSTTPNVMDGTIAAGEKLIADGSLKRMRRRIDERIRAGAMEDSGFAQVAESKRLPWCIFRGISDYGDPRKENGWQFVAALGAACAAMTFLRSAWRNIVVEE
jgi:nucleoside phosphorylase